MKTAIIDGVTVEAGNGAPRRGACPACGAQVQLWRDPRGGWYYRHAQGAGRGCPHRSRPVSRERMRFPPRLVRDDPALTLAVRITRVASIDALNGDREALAWLLAHPLPRITLQALHIDPEVALTHVARRALGEDVQLSDRALGCATFPGAIWSSG